MPEVLHAWIEGDYVGHFEKTDSSQDAEFFYDEGAKHHISLSLRRGEVSTKRAAQHYLDGLIPENAGARESMRSITGAKSTSSWDLLYAVEGDLPGGILLHPEKADVRRGTSHTRPAVPGSVAARIALIASGSSGLEDFEGKPRFSLAGAQGKFALSRTSDGLNFWPDAPTPSTHIVKPAREEHRGLNEVEARALDLARAMGVDSAYGQVETFDSRETFVVERFDRLRGDNDVFTRLHVEDLVQALGRKPEDKYAVSALDAVTVLRRYGVEDSEYRFVEQLAFNVAIGNADAHGKNYTLIHRGEQVELSPLYDTVPIALFPSFNQNLGMKIGKKSELKGVVPSDWVQLSKMAGLDEGRVLDIVRHTDQLFLEHAEGILGETKLVTELRGEEFHALLFRAERSLERNSSASAILPPAVSRQGDAQPRRKDLGLGGH